MWRSIRGVLIEREFWEAGACKLRGLRKCAEVLNVRTLDMR